MQIENQIAIVTGGASGIGAAVARELAARKARIVALVDHSTGVAMMAEQINLAAGAAIAEGFCGDVTDSQFRRSVFDALIERHGVPAICVPAAGVLRDGLIVKINKETGEPNLYPETEFRSVVEINLTAPIYWSMELVARIAQDRHRRGLGKWAGGEPIAGAIVLIGSVSSRGNRGQISYATCKAGLIGACATLQREVLYHGVRAAIVHPGFVDTPMVQSMGEKLLREQVLPNVPQGRLIRPQEIADAICFAIANDAVSSEIWLDGGWHW